MLSPQQHYQNAIAKGLVSFDESQQQALMELQQLHQQLSSSVNLTNKQNQPPILGLYLWGKVGRGKTFLMDSFVESFPKDVCLRQHFHHFMQDVHSQLTKLSGRKDPLKEIAKQLKSRHKILCFDEFFVTDIGDAMLLGRLIMFLFEQNMVVVATSNCEPSELYKDGLQRANFLPAINAIYKNMRIVELAGNKDHRERVLHTLKNYFVINESGDNRGEDDSFNERLKEFSLARSKSSGSLAVLGRKINYWAINEKAIVFDFKELCLGPRSHFDYIELAKQFNTVFLMNVPVLGGEMFERIKARGTEDGSVGSGDTGERQVMLARMDDGARRFIALIDELYDQQVALFLTCHVSLKELYTQGSLSFQFERARSRLIEMGSEEYMANSR
ncbi:MAG: AFG1 family ATPase [Oleispira sp.]|nr:AFG1 family ATPase [Oleispira sp.]MBL4879933.1 AFG1 family ATPase [Oleispira sp.]